MRHNWRLYLCGISHKASSTGQREPFIIPREKMACANAAFAAVDGVLESAVVSTCNRIEFYFVAQRTDRPFDIVVRFFQKFRGLDICPVESAFYIKKDRHAADHLMRVAAGLDSMVIGESQILGQLKDAYSSACATKTAGKVIHRLFHQAFRVGKQARSETEIGRGVCSVGGAAMEILIARFGEFDKPSILFIGASPMISLSADSISKLEYGRLIFANRTFEKARALAQRYEAEAYPLDSLDELLSGTNIIVSCTSSKEPVITSDILRDCRNGRGQKPLLIFDLAMPRDIGPGSGDIPGIEVIDLDSIDHILKDRLRKKEDSIPKVEEIIERRLDEFLYWYDHVRNQKPIASIDQYLEHARSEELSNLLSKLSPELKTEFDAAISRLLNRIADFTTLNEPDSGRMDK